MFKDDKHRPAPERESTNQSRRTLLALGTAAAVLAVSSASDAHHSFSQFDMAKLTTITGTVKQWTWANPHTGMVLNVAKPNGAVEEWTLVASSPNMMSRWGWSARDIRVGERVTLDIHPARDGRHIGAMKHLFLPGGRVLVDPAGASGQALASGPVQTPARPQGEPYR